MTRSQDTTQRIKQDGLIAIIRGDFPVQRMIEIGEAVRAGGIALLEVTLNSTGALEAIAALRRTLGDTMLIGAGTVRSVAQAEAALAAGAAFMVAPNFDPAVVAYAQAADRLHLPGVFTPTEAETAYRAGCPMLKLFPADAVGPVYLKAIRAPLNDIDFVPTGGITTANIAEYGRAGAAAVGIGSALVRGPQQSLDELQTLAAALRQAWTQGRV